MRSYRFVVEVTFNHLKICKYAVVTLNVELLAGLLRLK